MIRIEVRDHEGLLENEPIGHCEVPVHFFARPGGHFEWLRLNFRGMNAGQINFSSEFRPKEKENEFSMPVYGAGLNNALTESLSYLEDPDMLPPPVYGGDAPAY
jgi:hypothetical protein